MGLAQCVSVVTQNKDKTMYDNETWNGVSQLRAIPFSLKSTVISFENTGDITNAEVFVECVEDDIMVSGTDSDGVFHHYRDAGQYLKGDRVKSPDLHVVHTTGNVRVINDSGNAIKIPMGSRGSTARPANGNFTITPDNKKYKIRCFASHQTLPIAQPREPFWDEIKHHAASVTNRRITIPHTLGVIPAIVEINFVFIKNVQGYKIGDVLPLKFIGGRQSRMSTDETIWTTSADKDNVYFGMSVSNVLTMVNLIDNKIAFNLFADSAVQLDVYIKKDYPNPFNVNFTASHLAEDDSGDSPDINYYPGSGDILDSDLIIENTKVHGGSGFAPGTHIYYNQCGGTSSSSGTNSNMDTTDESSFIWHNHLISDRGFHNAGYYQNELHVDDLTQPQPQPLGVVDNNKLSFKSAPNPKMGGLVIYDHLKDKTVNIWDDTDGDWTITHRWQYEGGGAGYDADTGWIALEQYGISKMNMNISEFWSEDVSPSKIDIFLRLPQDSFSGMPLGATWSLANMKGGAKGYCRELLVDNMWSLRHDKATIKGTPVTWSGVASNSTPTIPNWSGSQVKDSSGVSFDNGVGTMQVRFCAYK